MTSRLTLSAAARQWGKSRQTLYTDMKAGRLSVGRDDRDAVFVDAAEMRRVYGEPPARRDDRGDETGHAQDETSETVLKDVQISRLEDNVSLLREQVDLLKAELDRAHRDKAEQAETHRQVLETQRQALRLLEHQRPSPAQPSVPLADRLRGLFGRRR